MNTYARIANGLVAELISTPLDPATLFNPALQWVAVVTPDVQPGWRHGSTGFSAPPPPTVVTTAPLTLSIAQLEAALTTLTAQVAALAAKAGG